MINESLTAFSQHNAVFTHFLATSHSFSQFSLGGFYCSSEICGVCLFVNGHWDLDAYSRSVLPSLKHQNYRFYNISRFLLGNLRLLPSNETIKKQHSMRVGFTCFVNPVGQALLEELTWPRICPLILKMMSFSLTILWVNLPLLSHPLLALPSFLKSPMLSHAPLKPSFTFYSPVA